MKTHPLRFMTYFMLFASIVLYSSLLSIVPSKAAEPEIISTESLPDLTLNMYTALLEAASNGDLEEVRDLFESNELAPVLSEEHISDPLAYWKKTSQDGTGRDIMASLAEVLSLPPVKTKAGHFIWPYLAALPLKTLTPKQQIDLFRLVGPKQAIEMLNSGTYTYYQTEIGKDGTWHHFKKPDPKK